LKTRVNIGVVPIVHVAVNPLGTVSGFFLSPQPTILLSEDGGRSGGPFEAFVAVCATTLRRFQHTNSP